MLGQTEALGARVIHVYGLTETYGPHTVCQWQVGWEDEEPAARARLLSRQGVAMVMADPIRVIDESGADVPRDGETVGEIVMCGNNVMKGYFDNPEGTAEAFRGGVFHSGDLGVWHPDGYIELRDRAKDVVISGRREHLDDRGRAGHREPPRRARGRGDRRSPTTSGASGPKAFVVARPGASPDPAALAAHVRERLAGYKCPDAFEIVDELPRTSTGKVRKYELREREWAGREARIN